MASVEQCSERFTSRSVSKSKDEITGVREFIVILSARDSNGHHIASQASCIPNRGQQDPGEPLIRVESLSCSPYEGDRSFLVTVNYSSKALESPLDKPAEITWGGSILTEDTFLDLDGTPVANSAGEPLPENIQKETLEVQVTYTVNMDPSFNFAILYQYANCINDGEFQIDGLTIPTKAAKMGIPSVSALQTENDIPYRTVSLSFSILDVEDDDDPWNITALDTGLEEKDAGGKRKPIIGADKLPIRKPWPLDGSGAAKDNADDASAELHFKNYKAKDFGVFGLA